jgi:hypothetical protein
VFFLLLAPQVPNEHAPLCQRRALRQFSTSLAHQSFTFLAHHQAADREGRAPR